MLYGDVVVTVNVLSFVHCDHSFVSAVCLVCGFGCGGVRGMVLLIYVV